MRNDSDFRSVVEELVATKNKLAQVTNELEALKAKKVRNKRVNPDKQFLNVLTKVRTKVVHQEMQSPELIKRITLKTLIRTGYSSKEFFSKFEKATQRLLSYEPFKNECSNHVPSLISENVAQHVVMAGEANINKVFKNGLKATFDTRLLSMDKLIFSLEDVQSYKEDGLSEGEVKTLTD